ncbi:MAG: hypothetical protein ABIQ13_05830 [Pedococcus sp.]
MSAAPTTRSEELVGQGGPEPIPTVEPSPRRMTPGRLAVALLVLLALVASTVVVVQVLGGSPPRGGVKSATAASSVATTSSGRDVGEAGTGVPGLTAPGVQVEAVPAASGDVDVVENVVFSGSATDLELTLPRVTGVSATARPKEVRITDLRVTADGAPVDTSTLSLARGGRLPLSNAVRAVELRYRLVGVVMVSRPSTAGRALVLLPPISAGAHLRSLPVVVEVRGTRVRNLVCPGLAARDQLCGRQDGEQWRTVPLESGATAVLAQLDLPTG